MKRALLWFGVMLLVGVVEVLLIGGRGSSQDNQVLLFFAGVANLIWICVGVAWGARGVVRYLKR